MKSGETILIISLVLLSFLSIDNIGATITGDSITGTITQSVGINITVISNLPTLTINKPKNQTYFKNESLEIEIESNGDAVWYNLDHGSNVSLTENSNIFRSHFNTTSGSHALYAFGNDSSGNKIEKNINFTINHGFFNVSYETFSSGNKNSTDFDRYSYNEIQNLSNIFFEDFSHGKIEFLSSINLTDDYNHTDGIVNITPYINISSNYIFINTNFLPNFNKSATLLLSGLTLTNPRIAMDGQVCPSTVCKKNSYSGGTLNFNVTHFTAFSAEETPSSSDSSTSSTRKETKKSSEELSVTIKPDSLTLNVINKENTTEEISLTNKGSKRVEIETEVVLLQDIIAIPSKIILEAGESKSITVNVKPIEKGLLTGRILFKINNTIIKEIPITVNVKSRKLLLNPKIIVINGNRLEENDKLKAKITILNEQSEEEINISAAYIIKDFYGNTFIEQSEILSISGKKEFIKEFSTENLGLGKYIIGIEIFYPEGFATASAEFEIVKYSYLIRIIVILVILGILVIGRIILLISKK